MAEGSCHGFSLGSRLSVSPSLSPPDPPFLCAARTLPRKLSHLTRSRGSATLTGRRARGNNVLFISPIATTAARRAEKRRRAPGDSPLSLCTQFRLGRARAPIAFPTRQIQPRIFITFANPLLSPVRRPLYILPPLFSHLLSRARSGTRALSPASSTGLNCRRQISRPAHLAEESPNRFTIFIG